MPRTILHVDMDQFYAAVELKRRPELRGKPVVVGGDPREGKGRGVVSTASYEARKFGIRSAMPVSTAWRLCPQAVFLPVDMPAYIAESEKVHEVFEAMTPQVEPISLDEAFLDVSASRLLYGDGPACARWIQAEVLKRTGLSCSVGVAPNKFLAKVASDLKKPGGLVVVEEGKEAEFLAPLPVGRLWGVGKVAEAKLLSLGIQRIGQLALWPLAALKSALGEGWAEHLGALARGLDARSVEPEHVAKSVGREQTFFEDTRDTEALRQLLGDQAEDVAARLRRHAWTCGTLQLKYRFEGFETHTRQRPLRPATAHGPELFKMAWEEMEAVLAADPRRLRLVGISAMGLEGGDPGQEELFGHKRDKLRKLDAAVDAIRDKHGDDAVKRANQSFREP
jgi:nucleotidyltransferase/DNA polymerase involved in DNA repair